MVVPIAIELWPRCIVGVNILLCTIDNGNHLHSGALPSLYPPSPPPEKALKMKLLAG